MALSYALMIVFYWLFLSSVVFVAGAFASRVFVTGPSGADLCLPYGKKKCLGESAGQIILLAAIFAFIANAIHLVFHASVMTETPLGEISSIIPIFLTKTKYGHFSLIRTGLLMAVALISYINVLRNSRTISVSGVLISIALVATISMSGHKGAEGYLNIPFALDMLHVISVSLWMGGLFFLIVCFSFLLKDAGVELWNTFKTTIRRFSDMATLCVTIALITGLGLSLLSVKSPSILAGTGYGLSLVIKTLMAVAIFLLGGVNKFYLLPSLELSGRIDWNIFSGKRSKLNMVVKVEAFIGLAVLLATSLLTHFSPGG